MRRQRTPDPGHPTPENDLYGGTSTAATRTAKGKPAHRDAIVNAAAIAELLAARPRPAK